MKIISKHKDYYDHAVHASMIDESIIYVRRTDLFYYDAPINFPLARMSEEFRVKHDNLGGYPYQADYRIRLAGLCVGGKTFPLWMTERTLMQEDEVNMTFPTKTSYNNPIVYGAPTIAEYRRRIADIHGIGAKVATDEEIRRERYPHRNYDKQDRREAAELNEALRQLSDFDSTALCLHYQTPILIVVPPSVHNRNGYVKDSGGRWMTSRFQAEQHVMVNPLLSAFNTQSILDPYQAWQEASMFIGGVIPGRQSPMVEISNHSKIEKAGFDPKYSFRKRPEG